MNESAIFKDESAYFIRQLAETPWVKCFNRLEPSLRARRR